MNVGSEVVQFGMMFGVFLIVFVAWLFVIYLPGRTMEGNGWEGDAEERAERKARNAETKDSSETKSATLEKETTTTV
ncbi:hypothetical protein [Rubrobacter indicoceani]|uniref:hypothetical protein n=1 Tax=Rubrobacter indicoceani TaxID=2051957 RepID=UPI000E5B67EA|nr:hypothetical protein [Rubrobacter indicoceani]